MHLKTGPSREATPPEWGRPDGATDVRAKRPPLRRELVLYLAVFAFYFAVANGGGPNREAIAHANARDLLDLERALRIAIEQPLNAWLAPRTVLATIANYEYAFTYVATSFGLLIWLYVARPDTYRWARSAFAIINLLGISWFAIYPTSPPRLLADEGYVDTVTRGHTFGSWGSPMVENANHLAAMPSLHVAWSIWFTIVIATLVRKWWVQGLCVLNVCLTTYVIMATANHFLLDAVGGALVVAVSFGLLAIVADRPGTRTPRLRPADAFFFYAEQVSGAAQHVGDVITMRGVADGRAYRERLLARFKANLDRMPRFRHRVAEGTFWRRPRWEPADDVDWDWHLPVTDLRRPDGSPGGRAALEEFVAGLQEQPLPRDRPLWRFHVVTGTAADEVTLVAVAHRVVAASRPAAWLFDADRRPEPATTTNANGTLASPSPATNANGTTANPNPTTNANRTTANPNPTTNANRTTANPNPTTNANGTTANANPTTNANGTTANPNPTTNANGTTANPNGTAPDANGTNDSGDGTAAKPNEPTSNRNGTTANADGFTTSRNGTTAGTNRMAAEVGGTLAARFRRLGADSRRVGATVTGLVALLRAGTTRPALTRGTNATQRRRPQRQQRRYAMARVPLATVRAVAHAYGTAVEDVLLAATAAAVRRIVPGGPTADDLRVLAGGAVLVDVPVGASDEPERLRETGRRTRGGVDRALAARFVVGTLSGVLAPPAQRRFAEKVYGSRFFEAIVSKTSMHSAGRAVHAVHPVVPLAPGTSVAVGVVGWDRSLGIGVTVDPAVIDDARRLAATVVAVIDELSRLAGVEGAPRRVRSSEEFGPFRPVFREEGIPVRKDVR